MKSNFHVLLLIASSLLVAVLLVSLSAVRHMSTVEIALFQILILGLGLFGSYAFGRKSAWEGAREAIKPHARAAFRRVLAQYNSLYRLSHRIEEFKGESPDHRLDLIQALVHEQIATGKDAMEDWRDIVPEEVEEVEKRGTRND